MEMSPFQTVSSLPAVALAETDGEGPEGFRNRRRLLVMRCRVRITDGELADAPPPAFGVLPRPKGAEGESCHPHAACLLTSTFTSSPAFVA
jgi:hypothetical protein